MGRGVAVSGAVALAIRQIFQNRRYSRIAGAGPAPAGSQTFAASRRPSASGIQRFSVIAISGMNR